MLVRQNCQGTTTLEWPLVVQELIQGQVLTAKLYLNVSSTQRLALHCPLLLEIKLMYLSFLTGGCTRVRWLVRMACLHVGVPDVGLARAQSSWQCVSTPVHAEKPLWSRDALLVSRRHSFAHFCGGQRGDYYCCFFLALFCLHRQLSHFFLPHPSMCRPSMLTFVTCLHFHHLNFRSARCASTRRLTDGST